MIIRCLRIKKDWLCSLIKASVGRCFGMRCRVVLQAVCKALKLHKYLVFNMLNSIYVIANVMKYGYLCKAKVP